MNTVNDRILKMLSLPKEKVDVVLDTDTYNEIDDQYALAYLIKSDDRLNLKALYAAPFFNHHSSSPLDGMEKSYEEIFKVLKLMKREDLCSIVHKGSGEFLKDESTPVISDAATDLVERAMNYSEENPLYVIAIGAITNIASALLIKPEIKNKIVLIWLGGNAYDWLDSKEFNLKQDVASGRVVFDSEVAMVQLPCMGVVSAFATSGPELEYWLRGKNELCDYLVDVTTKEAEICNDGKCWTRAIWDVTAVAWLLNDNDQFMVERFEHSPICQYDHHYSFDKRRHFIKYVYYIKRSALFEDLFNKLTK